VQTSLFPQLAALAESCQIMAAFPLLEIITINLLFVENYFYFF